MQRWNGHVYEFRKGHNFLIARLTNAEPFIKWLPKRKIKRFIFRSLLEPMLLLVFMQFQEKCNKDPPHGYFIARSKRQFETT